MASVPCNGCTACCQNELLILHPEMGDRAADYETQVVTNPITGKTCHALAQKANGDCAYLGDGGCTIHDRAPAICKEFDCRRFVMQLGNRSERRRLLAQGVITKDVHDAGVSRMKSLETAA